MFTIDELTIELQTKAKGADKSIENAAQQLEKLAAAVGKVNTGGLKDIGIGISALSKGMQGFKSVKMPDFTRLYKGLGKISDVDSAKLKSVADAINPLANSIKTLNEVNFDSKSITGLINSLTRLSNANVGSLENVDFSKIGNAINSLTYSLQGAEKVSSNTISITNAVAKLASAGAKADVVSASLPKLGNELRDFIQKMSGASKVSQETIQFTQALGTLANTGNKAATTAGNLGLLATELKKFMQVMSTAPTVNNNIIQMTNALANLASQGGRVGSASNAISKGFKSIEVSGIRVPKVLKGMQNNFRSLFRSIVPFIGIYQVFGFLKQGTEYASDLTEVQNVVDVTFGNMQGKMEDFAKSSIQNFGMSELASKQFASQFQAMGSAMGIDPKIIGNANKFLQQQTNGYVGMSDSMADVSLNLTKLTADMASFYNVEQAAVAEDLQAIFTGQTRPLRAYGLDLTQATLQEWALKQGLDADIQSMSQAEKTMLRYQYVLANTTASHGDFARTANTWANQVRILSQQFQQFGSIVGKSVIAAFKPFIQTLNKVMAKVITFSENVLNALGKIFGWQFEISSGGLTDDLGDTADYTDDIASGAGDASDGYKDAAKNAKKLKDVVLGIDELNINAPDDDTSGAGGSSGKPSGGIGGGIGTGAGAGGLTTNMFATDTILKAYESSIDSLYELGEYISNTLSNVLEGINWESVYKKAENFGTGLADFLNGLINPRLFYNLGKTVANSINTAFHAANAFAIQFDWKNLGKSLARSLKGFFENWDAGLTAETFSNFVKGILSGITEFINTLADDNTFEDIGQKLVDFICGVDWIGLSWNLYGFFKALAKALGDFPPDFAKGVAQEIVSKIFNTDDVEIKMPKWFDIFMKNWFTSPNLGLNLLMWLPDPEKVGEKTTSILKKIDEFKESVKTKFGETYKKITETFSPIVFFFSETFTNAYNAAKNAFSFINSWFDEKWKSIKEVFSPVRQFFSEKFTGAYDAVKFAFSFIGVWFRERYKDVTGAFKNVKQYFKDAFQGAYDAVKKIWDGIGKYFKGIANDIITPIGKAVNGVIGGINWILDKVGSKTRLSLWDVPRFASGTSGLPRDTVGVVNDQSGSTYKELIVPPSGKPFIPEGRNVVLPMEKGTKIMPAKQTKALMASMGINGMPHFAGGIGDFFGGMWEKFTSFTGEIWDYLSHPSKIVQIAIDKFTDTSGWNGIFGSIASGAVSTVFDSVVDYVKRLFDSAGGAGIEKAVRWAIGIANDNSHGYDQANRWGNPDYDCSALVISAFEQAGIKMKSGGATYTGNMYGVAKNLGFADVTGSVNLGNAGGMKRGDILLNRKNHTAIYIGEGKVVQASSNEHGGIRGGTPGDQTGKEIAVSAYYNYPWTDVLRYVKKYKNGIGRIAASDLFPAYEIGGFPEDGLFMANHNELVGRFSNGRTAVANNDQIAEGIEEATYRGYVRAHADTRETTLLEEIRDAIREGRSISIDGREIVRAYDSRKARNGFSFT